MGNIYHDLNWHSAALAKKKRRIATRVVLNGVKVANNGINDDAQWRLNARQVANSGSSRSSSIPVLTFSQYLLVRVQGDTINNIITTILIGRAM